jgi:phosphoglycolate phosphatase
MYKDIFLDFNGTIIDDLDLCVELLNVFLKEQGKKELSIDEYKHVFKFPIKQYYIDAGIDFNIESYESLAIRFIKEYQPRSMHCGLFPNLVDTVKKLKEMGIRVYILSASEQNNLLEQTNTYGITQYFDAVLGINNIHAASKVDRAINFMKDNGINPKETLFVGDTLHDKEVADAIGVNCVLVSCGHQAEDILEKSGCKVIPSASDIFTIL